MSQLGKLLDEYCPRGVDYRELGELVEILDSCALSTVPSLHDDSTGGFDVELLALILTAVHGPACTF